MIANKIRPKIQKVINKFPTRALVFRENKNDFGENIGNIELFEITGFYHEGGNTTTFATEKGIVRKEKQMFLMIICDDITNEIIEGDYILFLDKKHPDMTLVESNKKYYIKDKGNQNKMDIYFDMLLEIGI